MYSICPYIYHKKSTIHVGEYIMDGMGYNFGILKLTKNILSGH